MLEAVRAAVARTFAERSARVEYRFSAELGAAAPKVDLPILDVFRDGFSERGCVDFARRRSRLVGQYPRVVADGVEYQPTDDGRWRSSTYRFDDWPPMHPCWFLQALVSGYRAGREGADGRLDLDLDPAIVEQGPGARPAWTEAAATLERDEEGRAVRLTVRLSAPADDAWVQSEVEFSNLGTPCEADPPAPEDTVTFDEWVESLMERPPEG